MNKFIKFFNFGLLKRLDRYLLLNHTLIWNFKLHYISFYSLSIILFVIFMDLKPSQISTISIYIISMTTIIYLFWLYLQNKHTRIKEYNKVRLHGRKEYFLYTLSTIIYFLPIFILSILFFQTMDNLDNFRLFTYVDSPKGFIFIDGISHLNTLNQDFVNKTVAYVNSSDIVTLETFKLAKQRIESMLIILGVNIAIIIFFPIQIIFFKYIKIKRSIFFLFILYLYLFIMFILIKDTNNFGTSKETVSFVLEYILIGNLFFLLYKKYRVVLIFNLFLYGIHFLLSSFLNIWTLIFIIEFFLFEEVAQYLAYLMSKPKK